MPTRLRKLKVHKVALVRQGACPEADVVLFKTAAEKPVTKDDSMSDMPLTLDERMQQAELWDEWYSLWRNFECTVAATMACCEDPAHHAAILDASVAQFATHAHELLGSLGLVEKASPVLAVFDEFSKAGAVMSAARMKRLHDAISALQAILDEAAPRPTEKGTPMAETLEGVTKRAEMAEARVAALEHDLASLKTVEKELAEAKAELAVLKQTPEEQEAAYLKSLPEAVRKQYEADKLEKAALREELAKEREARQRGEFIEKTATYRALGITPDHWNILKAIDGLPEQERTELTRILASATEVVKQSAHFKTLGVNGGNPGDGTAAAEFEALAKVKVEKGEAKTLAQGIDLVSQERPDLYRKYRAELRG